MKNILIVAGEASGDLHGAALVREMNRLDEGLSFFGIGGDSMEQAGVEILEHAGKMAVVGFTEVIGKYPSLRSVFHRVIRRCSERNPVRAILIDYPGFNLKLARKLTGAGIPVTYYIPPQVWAWREKRVQTLSDYTQQILCILPFEPEWYAQRGVSVTFVGHPLLDSLEETVTLDSFREKHALEPGGVTLGLMPGSRQHEIDRHLPIMADAVSRLKKNGYNVRAVIGRGRGVKLPGIDQTLFSVEEERPRLALQYGTLGLVASGTATLEGALYGTPCVVIYRMSGLSWDIGRRMAKVNFVSLPNLIAGKEVFPELLQKEATGERAAGILKLWIDSSARTERIQSQLEQVRDLLGRPGASRRAAELILKTLQTTSRTP